MFFNSKCCIRYFLSPSKECSYKRSSVRYEFQRLFAVDNVAQRRRPRRRCMFTQSKPAQVWVCVCFHGSPHTHGKPLNNASALPPFKHMLSFRRCSGSLRLDPGLGWLFHVEVFACAATCGTGTATLVRAYFIRDDKLPR